MVRWELGGEAYEKVKGITGWLVRWELEGQANEKVKGMIGWFGLVPRLGGANAPGDFAHIAVFPDLESAMKRQESLSEGGWIGYRDYQRDFATCRGEQLLSEQVIHRPGE